MAIKIAGSTVINDDLVATVEGVDLSALDASIADTAVDVFVYDTSKDSDGGAWRKRTQHTSWYNETLDTATRGSRREFPAVAVIVAEATQVTIYDGDDSDLPMWAVLDANSIFSGVSARNGFVCMSIGAGIICWGFVDETLIRYITTGKQSQPWTRDATGSDFVTIDSGLGIANNDAKDIAMTVLPNAPIDAATGLPVPTIAVATDDGVSVINNDGTVADSASSTAKIAVNFDGSTLTLVNDSNGATWVTDDYSSNGFASTVTYNVSGTAEAQIEFASTTALVSNTLGATQGLTLLSTSEPKSASMHCNVTSTYNTGWMNGDIKLATLSDTDDTNVTGSNLITGDNSTFTSSIGDWVAFSGATLSHDTDRMQIVSNGTDGYAKLNISGLTSGKKYVLTFDFDAATGGKTAYLGTTNLETKTYSGTTGTASWTFTYAGETYILVRASNTSGITSYVDNVTLRLAEEDRSVNGNGLQVFGTITKNPVATGADLVGYSGWSSSNYLQQPYNSDLNFGTGDFCVMGWCNLNSSDNNYLWSRRSTSDEGFFVFQNPGSYIRFRISEGGNFTTLEYSGDRFTLLNDKWAYVVTLRESGVLKLYINGDLVDTESGTVRDIDSSGAVFTIASTEPFPETTNANSKYSLVRVSATAPTAEQIAKIYEDEKFLFQDNAQATLYGSSDAVTALAHDDDTNLLHVGTSAGRSVFSGLRRVSNTTTAVGSAISASNGLVAED
jgi:trimeric autotransporter adhesin